MTKNANAKTWQLPVQSNGRRYSEPNDVPGAFDYYIGPSGSDSNPGTLASPWAITSLQDTNSNNSKMAGKRVGLLPGTYDIHALNSGSGGNYTYPVLDIPPGSAGTPTYIGSSGSSGYYSPRTVTIYNVGSTSVNAPLGQRPSGTGNFTIDGLVVNLTGFSGGGINCNYGGNLSTGPGTVPGITIKNCEIFGMNGTSNGVNYALISMQNVYGAVIIGNKLHDCTGWDINHVHCYLEYCCTNSQITYNTMYNSYSGTHMKVACAGQTIAYNYFYNLSRCGVQGLDGAYGNPNSPSIGYSIHHNVFDNVNVVSLMDVNSSRYQNNTFYNNTIYNSGTTGISGLNLVMAGGATCDFHNNICYTPNATSGWGGGVYGPSSGGASLWDYNCYFASAYTGFWSIYGSAVYNSLASWQGATGTPDTHSFTSNPSFVSSITSGGGAAQFKLSGGSPCNGAGQSGATMGAWDGSSVQVGAAF